MSIKKLVSVFILCFGVSWGYAEETIQPLLPDQAFLFTPRLSEQNQLMLQWNIAPGYYVYRDQLHVELTPASRVKLGTITLPKGIEKNDSLRGLHQVYTDLLTVTVPLVNIDQGMLDLMIGYQGCSAKGFCYSPIQKSLHVDLGQVKAPLVLTDRLASGLPSPTVSEQDYAQQLLNGQNLFFIVMVFMGLGLLLAFTPCVLPMVPILSSIIVGHHKDATTLKTFLLSLAYVLGMAVNYAMAGIMIALAGSHIQSTLQKPWIILLFSGIFVLLALSLFGLYQLRLPARWQERLTEWSNKQKGGTYIGVFLMGGISSLIVSPCVSPPLVGVLAYIAQTGNTGLGAMALFALGLGMGIPLLVLGVSAKKLLPKPGPWMSALEKTMGVVMLGFAIWLASRVLPGSLALFLWSFLCIGSAVFLWNGMNPQGAMQRLRLGFSLVVFLYGIILMMGAALGNTDPLHPWENWKVVSSSSKEASNTSFVTLTTMQQLDALLSKAKQEKKPVMIDFYADWCQSCLRMERHVLSHPDIKQVLSAFIILRADVTKHNVFDQALLKRFQVIAPPTWVFFDSQGNALTTEQMVGERGIENFLSHLKKVQPS